MFDNTSIESSTGKTEHENENKKLYEIDMVEMLQFHPLKLIFQPEFVCMAKHLFQGHM